MTTATTTATTPLHPLLGEAQALIRKTELSHIAVIMDGNRRWAKQHVLETVLGHHQGVKSLKKVVRFASDAGLKVLTVYSFSTENWNRDEQEVGALMHLFAKALGEELADLHANQVRLRFIGDLTVLPSNLQDAFEAAMQHTKDNTGMTLQIAVNYGSRQELINAVNTLVANGRTITEDNITGALYSFDHTASPLFAYKTVEPELLIRTGGEQRISNFLLWQCAYTEFYFTETLWPDFDEASLLAALQEYSNRHRRFGQ